MASQKAAEEALARARARIGRASPALLVPVDRADIRRFAAACGETWPPYRVGDEAPPAFVAALQSDALGAGDVFEPDLPFARFFHGDDVVEHHRAIRPGDVLSVTARLIDARLRDGRHGPTLFQYAEMRFDGEDGAAIARVVTSMVSF